jgi:hypothetical protein
MTDYSPNEERPEAGVRDPSDVSAGELIGAISRDLSTLMRQEMDLAKAEVREEAIKAGKAGSMLGGSGFGGYMTLLFLSIAAWAALSNVMDEAWAGLIVAAVWAVVAATLFVMGRNRIRQLRPKPERTVETLKETPSVLTHPTSSDR